MGCGLTRAFCCMAHGEFLQAIRLHPVAPLFLLWIAAAWVLALIRFARPCAEPRWLRLFGKGVVITMLLLYCGRMVVFFSAPDGARSMLTQNAVMRLIRLDFSNTYEPSTFQ